MRFGHGPRRQGKTRYLGSLRRIIAVRTWRHDLQGENLGVPDRTQRNTVTNRVAEQRLRRTRLLLLKDQIAVFDVPLKQSSALKEPGDTLTEAMG